MFVIVEGLDRCGKSTLIKRLRNEVITDPRTICHHSINPPKGQAAAWEIDHYCDIAEQAAKLGFHGWNFIADRFHLGMVPYGMKYRGNTFENFLEVDTRVAYHHKNAFLFFIEDEPVSIVERDDGESLEKSFIDLRETRDKFRIAFKHSAIKNKLKINLTDIGGFDIMQQMVMEFIYENN